MAKPISVQLYSLREEMKDGRSVEILRMLADTGYVGVEPAGFHGLTPAEFRNIVEDLGMTISSNHGPMPSKETRQQIIELYGALGTKWAVAGFGPSDFESKSAIDKTIARANDALEALEGTGLSLCLHNHWWEFEELDGRLKYDYLLEAVPGLKLEIDTYWCANFGANDPAAMVEKYKAITPLLHIKDGPLEQGEPHVAAGSGKMKIPGVIEAADPGVLEWNVVELDACATDMAEAVRQSYRYLVGEGLAEGRK